MKIGMYNDDEILEHLTNGEGRGFLGRSMYDAIIEELQRKDKEIKQLQEDIVNHIKIASEYKEQMIIKDNIINELKYGIQKIRDLFYEKCRIRNENGYYSMNNSDLQDFYDILDKIKELESK